MRVKQAKLGQALKGETSNILTDSVYDMTFDKGMLHVKKIANSKYGPFIVFPANLAYIEIAEETQALQEPKPEAKKGKK